MKIVRDPTGYYYTSLTNGNTKRVLVPKGFKHQTGGASTKEIADAFENPDYPARPYKKRDIHLENEVIQKVERPDSWYEYLGVDGNNVADMCSDKDEDIIDIAKAWGHNMLSNAKPSRKPNKNEIYNQDIDPDNYEAMEPIYNYDTTVIKPAEYEVYRKCNLQKDDVDALGELEREKCEDLVCRGDHIDRYTGKMKKTRINSIEDFDAVLADNPEKASIYNRCKSIGIGICPNQTGEIFDPNLFVHLENPGVGDCFFVAVGLYIDICDKLGFYPTPGSVEATGIDMGSIDVPLVRAGTNNQHSMDLRKQVIDWYKENKYYKVAGNSLINELASLVIDQARRHDTYGFKNAHNTFIKNTKEEDLKKMGFNKITNNIKTVAKKVTSYLNDNVSDDCNRYIDLMFQAYLDSMEKIETYAGAYEVIAMSNVLKKNIIVLQRNNVDGSDVFSGNMGNIKFDETIYIYHLQDVNASSGGLHYEILLPVTPDKMLDNKYKFSAIMAKYDLVKLNVFNDEHYVALAYNDMINVDSDIIEDLGYDLFDSYYLFTNDQKKVVQRWFEVTYIPIMSENYDLDNWEANLAIMGFVKDDNNEFILKNSKAITKYVDSMLNKTLILFFGSDEETEVTEQEEIEQEEPEQTEEKDTVSQEEDKYDDFVNALMSSDNKLPWKAETVGMNIYKVLVAYNELETTKTRIFVKNYSGTTEQQELQLKINIQSLKGILNDLIDTDLYLQLQYTLVYFFDSIIKDFNGFEITLTESTVDLGNLLDMLIKCIPYFHII